MTGATGHTADGFRTFFVSKVDDVVDATAVQPLPPVVNTARSLLPSFRSCTQAEVRRIIMTSPAKSCSQGPIQTFLYREFVDLLLPYTTSMVIASLPHSQKHAIVDPMLKKPGLDIADMANYRPVSNLTFMSKVTERAVAQQLHEYLAAEDLLPRCQSAYRKQHSTETAMLRPPIVRHVHCRLEQGHSQSWPTAAPVRGRLPSLREDIS